MAKQNQVNPPLPDNPPPEANPTQMEGSFSLQPVEIPLNQIKLNGGTQIRQGLNPETIQTYREALREGAHFPPIEVFQESGQAGYWLADGFHRIEAARLEGWQTFSALVKPGGYREALLAAIGANATHGLPRSSADKRTAVLKLLEDTEWSKWADREIARHAHVSHTYVAHLRAEFPGKEGQNPAERLVQRGGTVYTQQIGKIGKSAKPVPVPRPAKSIAEKLLEPLHQLPEAELQALVTELQKLFPKLFRQPVMVKPVLKPPAAKLAGWLQDNYSPEELKQTLTQLETPRLPSLEEEVRRRRNR